MSQFSELSLIDLSILPLSHGEHASAQDFANAIYRDLGDKLREGGLHYLNTTIIPSSVGLSRWQLIPLPDYAPEIIGEFLRAMAGYLNEGCWGYPNPQSHLGHQGTVDYMRAEIPAARGWFKVDRTPWDGQGLAIVVQLNGRRLKEGEILSEAEMRAIGAAWRLLYMV